MSAKALRSVPLTMKDLKRMAPYIRGNVGIPVLTSVLNSEINCTLCGGSKLALNLPGDNTGAHWSDCPNCFDPVLGKSTGKMKSRTNEEQWLMRRSKG